MSRYSNTGTNEPCEFCQTYHSKGSTCYNMEPQQKSKINKETMAREFVEKFERKDAKARAMKTWLCYAAIALGSVMMLMGAALLAYFESIYVGP